MSEEPEREEARPAGEEGPDLLLIELIFFAYRDFVGEPDRVLARYRFGRAHHRVLHFVAHRPGLTVQALLDILQITKQSLARVLRELIEGGFVEARAGREDRRQRRLFATPAGRRLAAELAAGQHRRVAAALAAAGPQAREPVRRFLLGLIDGRGRDHMAGMTRRADPELEPSLEPNPGSGLEP